MGGEFASVSEGLAPLIPDGKYIATVVRIDRAVMFGKALKLVLTFRIADGPHQGVDVPRYYNVKHGGRGKKSFRVGRHSTYLRDYVRLFGRPQRVDRMGLTQWKQHVFTITTATVKTDSTGRDLHPNLRYSKVAEVDL